MPKNQDLKSYTNRDDGISVGKPRKETVSKGCTEKDCGAASKTESRDSLVKTVSKSRARNDYSLTIPFASKEMDSVVVESECSSTVNNDVVIMPTIGKTKLNGKTGCELNAKKQNLYFKREIFSELFFQEVIPVVRKCLIWFIFHRWPYKVKKLSESSIGRISKISQVEISGNFSNSIYHRWKQKQNETIFRKTKLS